MIQFDIGFKVDARTLESQLSVIKKDIAKAFTVEAGTSGGMGKELSQAVVQARNFQSVLEKATTNKGLSFVGMNAELRKAGTSATSMVTDLMKGGTYFQATTNQALESFSNANRQALIMNKTIAEMGRVFLQSLKFTVAQQAIQALQSSIQQTVQWVVRLDAELNQIQVVSGKTAEQMSQVSREVVERSKALRVAALDYAQASQIYYQQGLRDDEVIRRADITIKAAQAANENVKNMSDMLTAVWNTYDMQGEQLERAASIGAMLGADTAIEFRDIAEAMQISASAASQMGVSYESLASIIATVGSVTRQSSSIIGNAYKTIFARFQSLKSDGTDGEVTLGKVSSDLQDLGVDILDKTTGEIIALDDVIMKTGNSWDTYTKKQQIAIAQLVGGTRQYGQFLALMENFDDYVANLNKSNAQTDASVLEDQYETTLDSLDSRIRNVSESWKRAFSNLYDEKGVKSILTALEAAGNLVGDIVTGFGGVQGILTVIGSILISKLPQGLKTISSIVRDINDSLTPGRRIARINTDADAMRDEALAQGASRMPSGERLSAADRRNSSSISAQTSVDVAKIENARQAAIAQEQLNTVMKEGSAIQSTQASALSEEIKVRQAKINTIYDEVSALQREVEQVNALYQVNNSALANSNMNLPTMTGVTTADDAFDRGMSAERQLGANGFEEQRQKMEELVRALTDGEKNLTQFKRSYNAIVKSVGKDSRDMANALTQVSQIMKSGFDNTNTTEGLEGARKKLKDITKLIQDMLKYNKKVKLFDDTQAGEIESLLERIQKATKSGATPDVVQGGIADVSKGLREQLSPERLQDTAADPSLRNLATSVGEVSAAYLKGGQTAQDYYESLQRVEGLSDNIKRSNDQLGQSMATMAGGIMMSVRGLDSLIQGFKSGNMTIGSFIGNMTMLISGITMVTRGIATLKTTESGYSLVRTVSIAMTEAQAGATATLATVLPVAAAGMKALGDEMGKAIMKALPVVAIIMAIVAAVYLLMKAVQMMYNAYKQSTPEAQLSRQRKAVEELKKAADEAAASAQALQESFDKYDSARKVLEECTQGTQEWRDQLRETNLAALDVLDSINSLNAANIDVAGLFTRGEDGDLVLNEAKMEQIIQNSENNAAMARYRATLANMQAESTALLGGARDIGRDLNADHELIYTSDGRGGQIATNPIWMDGLAKQIRDMAEELSQMTDDQLSEALAELGLNLNLTSDELDNYRKSFQEQANANHLFSEKQAAAAEAILSDLGEDYSDEVRAVVMDRLSADDIDQRVKELYMPTNWADFFESVNGSREKIDDFVKTYSDAVGVNYRAADNFARSMDGVKSFAFLDDNGELVEKTREEVAMAIATTQSLQDLQVSAAEASRILKVLAETGKDGESMSSYIRNGNFNDMTRGALSSNFGSNFDRDSTDSQALVQQYLQDAFDIDPANYEAELEKIASAFGQTTDEFLADIYQGIEDSFKGLAGVGKNMGKRARALFTTINQEAMDALTINEQNQVSTLIQDAFTKLGQENAAGIASMLDEINPRQLGKFLAEIQSVNWNTITPEKLAERLEEAEISTEGFSDQLPQLIYLMKQVAGIDLKTAQESFKTIMEEVGSLQYGDSIDDKTFDKLSTKYQEYFTLMADGTYQLTERAAEFRAAIGNEALAQHRELLRENRMQLDNIALVSGDNASSYRYESLSDIGIGLDISKYSEPVGRALESFINGIEKGSSQDLMERISDAVVRDFDGPGGTAYAEELRQAVRELDLTDILGETLKNGINGSIDLDQIQKQLNYMVASGNYDEAQMSEWQAGIDNQNLTPFEAADIAAAVKEAGDQTEYFTEQTKELTEAQIELRNTLAMQRIVSDLEGTGVETEELYQMRDALLAVAGTTVKVDGVSIYYSKSLKDNAALAAEMAKEQLRFNQALKDGADNLEDWKKMLGPGGIKDMQKFGEQLGEMRKAYASLLDVDESTIGDDFVKDAKNLELFEKILTGSVEEATTALDQLDRDFLLQLDFDGLEIDKVTTYVDAINGELSKIGGEDGAFNFDDLSTNAQSALNELLMACGTDVAKIEAMFNALNIDPITTDDLLPETVAVDTTMNIDQAEVESQSKNQTFMARALPAFTAAATMMSADIGVGGFTPGLSTLATYAIPQWTYDPVETTATSVEQGAVIGYQIEPGTGMQKTHTNKTKTAAATPPSSDNYRGGGKRGGGGGGGGGGGKKSTYSKPTEKPRYVNNTNRQEATANSISKIDTVEKNLYGRAKLAAMEKKNQLIADQAKDYQRLYQEAKSYLAFDQAALADTRLGQTMQVEYDNNGNILNQEQIDNWMIDWKDAIGQIEDETQKETEQIAFDLSETAWNHLKDSRDQMIKFLQSGIEQLQSWIEAQIASTNYQYEIDVKVNDREIRMLEYTLTKLGESGLMSGDGLDILKDQVESYLTVAQSGADTAEKLIQLYDSMKTGNIDNQLGADMFGADVWQNAIESGSLTATILEAIGDNTEDLLGYAEELANAYVEAWNQVSDALSAYLSEFDSLNKKMENASILLDTWVSIWEESGEKYKDNSTYLRLLQTRMDAVGNSVETTKDKYLALQEAEEAAKEAWEIHKDMYEEGEITGQQWDAVNEMYKAARDAMLDAQADYYSSVQDYITAIKEYEQQAAEQIMYTWDQALSNLWADVNDSMTGYDMITQIQEFFLADFEKDYHLDKLLRQTSDAMGDLTDPGRLSEYQKFLDEINEKQAEGVKLTQTDVDIMNARFKLLQAQDAYEEAQNSKNTMRTTRDASGNYVYVFSGDDTSGAEQDLEDAAYELQKITEEAAKAAASSWYETWLAYQNYVKEIDQTRYNSDEKYAQQVDYMRQMYETQLVQLKDKVIEYNDMAGFTFSETALGLMTQSENMQHTQETYVDAVGDLFTELNEMYREYDDKIKDTASQFENANSDMKESAEDAMTAVRDQMAETARESGRLADDMANNWTQMIQDTSEWSIETIDQINAVIEKLEEYYRRQTEVMKNDDGFSAGGDYKWMQDDNGWWFGDGQGGFMQGGWFQDDKGDWYYANSDGYIEQADPGGTKSVGGYYVDESGRWTGAMEDDHTIGAWKEAEDTKPNKGGTYDDYANGTAGNNSGDGPGSGSSDGDFSNSEDDQWHGGNGSPWWYGNSERALYSGWKKIKGRWYHFDSNGYLTGEENGYDQKGNGGNAKWQGYAMGGFTGSTPLGGMQGIDQFPAMLAPGEYVLNPEDTYKILKAVKIVKGMSSLGLSAAADAISSLASSATRINSNADTVPVQQDVRIEASFPGVSVASEIEEALNNLVNETVQYIGGQNR